jgi:uncharacterized membrane protein YobD (UPF0266 family)
MILMYYKEQLHPKANRVNNERTKSVAVHDYNQNIGAIHLRDQMLLPVREKKGSNWDTKLFSRLLIVVIHNSTTTYQSHIQIWVCCASPCVWLSFN